MGATTDKIPWVLIGDQLQKGGGLLLPLNGEYIHFDKSFQSSNQYDIKLITQVRFVPLVHEQATTQPLQGSLVDPSQTDITSTFGLKLDTLHKTVHQLDNDIQTTKLHQKEDISKLQTIQQMIQTILDNTNKVLLQSSHTRRQRHSMRKSIRNK